MLILSLTICFATLTPEVSVSKCCPDEQVLDVSDPGDPKCVDTTSTSTPFITIRGLEIKKSPVKELELKLIQDQERPNSMPGCTSDFEVHLIEDSGKIFHLVLF